MNPKVKCIICGEEFEIYDIRNPQKVCNKKSCRQNWEYVKKHMDPITGDYPDPGKVGKW